MRIVRHRVEPPRWCRHHALCAINQDLVPRYRVGVGSNIRNTTPAALGLRRRDFGLALVVRFGEVIAHASSRSAFALALLVPHGLGNDRRITGRGLQAGAATRYGKWARRGEVDMISAIALTIGRSVISRRNEYGFSHRSGFLKGLVEGSE